MPHKTACPLNHARTLKNHQLILRINFKVITIGKVPYTSLVLGKNNKVEPQEQNFGD